MFHVNPFAYELYSRPGIFAVKLCAHYPYCAVCSAAIYLQIQLVDDLFVARFLSSVVTQLSDIFSD